MKIRWIIKVFGIVQGVGFRPFIHKLVNIHKLTGWVQNDTSGVTIDVEGEREELVKFVDDIRYRAPELAVIEDISVETCDNLKGYADFKIVKSQSEDEGFVLISPDVSICEDCSRELGDPENRRYGFPFINCTNCGPRFTIIEDLPYDRDKTTMDEFTMCSRCSNEYHNIEDRRYHAQPNCCEECGPELDFIDCSSKIVCGDAIKCAAQKIEEGYIVAIKGLGGFHLACNALSSHTVSGLRKRKHRDQKPFALMCRDIDTVKKYACVSCDEQKLLEGIRRPIVLLEKLKNCDIPKEVAPDSNSLGFMLPYTPLHYLIFKHCSLDTLIMTSANISDNPVIYTNDEAVLKLGKVADYFLMHNRRIHTRCDDSVVRVLEGREYFIRRSRGYAPFPIKLNAGMKQILACGAEQKASFSLSRDRYVFLSQHIGDLKNYETLVHYETQIENFKRLFKIEPEIVACDLHPDYLSSRYADEKYSSPKAFIQHHHAHMASCMADNNLDGKAIGITWDGTGLGIDGDIWGGEFLTGGYSCFERAGSFLKLPMPGGDKSVKDLGAMAFSFMFKTFGEDAEAYWDMLGKADYYHKNADIFTRMIKNKVNSPFTSSCGRLFDGVSYLLGLCSTASYEGQGAVRLETAAFNGNEDILDYGISKNDGMLIYDWRPTIRDIVSKIEAKKDVDYIASAFHNTLAVIGAEVCGDIRNSSGLNRVVLSGGVFQNILLLRKLTNRLKNMEFEVYIHNRVSPNDEGISLGQLVIAHNGGGFNVSGCSA